MRIATLLPSATEIVCALGLRECLVGISHSCDFPDGLDGLPRLTSTGIPLAAPGGEIDAAVRQFLGGGQALYRLDLDALAAAAPDLIVSQRLCDVCAVSAAEVDQALCVLPGQPVLVDLEPSCLEDVFADIQRVARAAGIAGQGEAVAAGLRARAGAVAQRTERIPAAERPRLAMIEWLEPPFDSGHWNPELVELAGAVDVLGPKGQPSRTIPWASVLASGPDIVLLSCCGFDVPRTREELAALADDDGWQAVRRAVGGRVLIIDGDAYFSRPGPRLVDALEALAHALHPRVHPGPAHGARVEAL